MNFGEVSYKEAEMGLLSLGNDSRYPNGGSSHISFRKENCATITLVRTQEPVKRYLLEKIQNAILLEETK
jgi:hypothetical protein